MKFGPDDCMVPDLKVQSTFVLAVEHLSLIGAVAVPWWSEKRTLPSPLSRAVVVSSCMLLLLSARMLFGPSSFRPFSSSGTSNMPFPAVLFKPPPLSLLVICPKYSSFFFSMMLTGLFLIQYNNYNNSHFGGLIILTPS